MSHFPALCLSYVTDGDRCSGLRLQSPEQIWYFDTLFFHNCLHSTIHTCSPASTVEDVHVRVCMRMFKSSCLTVLCHQYCEKDWSTLVWHLSLYASFACLCRGCSSLVFPLFELADGPKCVRDETTLDPRAKWARLFPVFREKRARKKAFRAHRGTAALAYTHTHIDGFSVAMTVCLCCTYCRPSPLSLLLFGSLGGSHGTCYTNSILPCDRIVYTQSDAYVLHKYLLLGPKEVGI